MPFYTSYVQDVIERLCPEVLVLLELYMVDSKSGGKKVYSNVCESTD